jgi:hypothetical protein
VFFLSPSKHNPEKYFDMPTLLLPDGRRFQGLLCINDRLCGSVTRVYFYRSRGLRFDSQIYQIFLAVGFERGPLSLVKIIEKLFE